MPGGKNTQSQASSLAHNRSLLSALLAHPVNGGAGSASVSVSVNDPFASSASTSTAFPFAPTAPTAPQSTDVNVQGAVSAEKSGSRSLRVSQTKTSSAALLSSSVGDEGEGEREREGVRGRESTSVSESVRESQQKMFSLLPPELRSFQPPCVSKNDLSHTDTDASLPARRKPTE